MTNHDTMHPSEARLRAGLTQQALADRAGVCLSTIVRAERLGRWPRSQAIREAILRALGLTPTDKPRKGGAS